MTVRKSGEAQQSSDEGNSSHMRQRFDPLHARASSVPETDENGDYVFRFKLEIDDSVQSASLVEFYRDSIVDLLKLVRFYSNGKPVIFDSFSFQHKPDEKHPLFVQSK